MRRAAVAVGILAAILRVALAGPPGPTAAKEAPEPPPTNAEKVAGRWRITLLGLPADHRDILASLAVDGEMLVGTLTVGQETVKITSGRLAGTDFSFAFKHVSGETFKMRGGVGPRGLEGTWEARGDTGRWRAERLKT